MELILITFFMEDDLQAIKARLLKEYQPVPTWRVEQRASTGTTYNHTHHSGENNFFKYIKWHVCVVYAPILVQVARWDVSRIQLQR
jgi:hypothetical protein